MIIFTSLWLPPTFRGTRGASTWLRTDASFSSFVFVRSDGWLVGHQHSSEPEPNYSADVGDFSSFIHWMKKKAIEKDVDLLLVDSGGEHALLFLLEPPNRYCFLLAIRSSRRKRSLGWRSPARRGRRSQLLQDLRSSASTLRCRLEYSLRN